ncbi:MAG: extracellular solute-binding protein, partial [Treponema sp.]|nr:extracellular solute-binding protein [Treponema sp.]
MKNTLVFALLCCVFIALFAGCKKGGRSGDGNYPITISIYHETGGSPQPSPNNPIAKYLEEKFNVTFSWDILVGDARQKQGVMIASGDYPDIVELRGNEWIEAGALIPLQDLIMEHGPRIYELYKDVWDKLKSADGNIYYLVNFGVYQGLDHNPNYDGAAFWLQKDILRDAGYPTIRTVDEYFDLIRNYYRKNPTINGQPTIPFAILTHDWRIFELWNPPNFLAGNPNDGNGVVNPNTYEYKAFFTMDISKRWFQKLNELDKEGLIDRTSFT